MSGRAFHSLVPAPAPTASPAGVGRGGGHEEEKKRERKRKLHDRSEKGGESYKGNNKGDVSRNNE